MQNLARILVLLLLTNLAALAQAKYAGNWTAVVTPTKTPNPPGTEPRQFVDFDVYPDGTITGVIYSWYGDPLDDFQGIVSKTGRISTVTSGGSVVKGTLSSRSKGSGTATFPGWRWSWTAYREYP